MTSSYAFAGNNQRTSGASHGTTLGRREMMNKSWASTRLRSVLLTTAMALISSLLLSGQVSVLTNRYDNGRTGLNPNESFLNPANVKSATFAKLGSYNVDGYVVAQPLYMQNVTIGGTSHNVVFVATMHDSLYAFDAENITGAPLWQHSFINPGSGITPVPIDDQGCKVVNGYSEVGIQGTPVIDPVTSTLYVDVKTKEVGINTSYVHRLHAVDIKDGTEKFGGPVQIKGSVQGANGTVTFDSAKGCQRAGLLLTHGTLYIAFGSNGCDGSRGWVFAYDADTLTQLGAFSTAPNQTRGANIWQGGAGLAADANGNVIFLTANGVFNVNTGGSDFGDSFVKLTLTGNVLTWSDYFTPFDQANMGANDLDLGSGGTMLLNNPSVVIGAGKTGTIYVVDPNNMGGFNPNNNNQIIQWLQGALNEVEGTPAFWDNGVFKYVFFAPAHGPASVYSIDGNGQLTKLLQQTAPIQPVAGPTLSSNGSSNGIMWLVRNFGSSMQLSAFDAAAMSETYNSTVAGSRDTLGTTPHFVIPTVADGRVYVGTQTQLVVYGLMPVISNISGGNQTGKAGSTLPLPLTIRVTDPYTGSPLSGVTVTFSGPGSFGNQNPKTDSTGTASTTYTLPTTFTSNTLTITVSSPGYASTTFVETVTAGSPASIKPVSGGTQTGTVGTTLPKAIVFKVSDQYGNGVPNIMVTFSDSPNHGGFSSTSVWTDSLGKATVTYTLPTKAGYNTITASGGGFNASVQERAVAGNPTSLSIASGNNQTGHPNTLLQQPLKVKATDQFMNVVAGVTVNFTDNGAGGTLSAPSVITNASGIASVSYTTPNKTGNVTITASSAGLNSVNFTEKVQ